MKKYFPNTLGATGTFPPELLTNAILRFCPSTPDGGLKVSTGRWDYMPLEVDHVKDFLRDTRLNRNKWREAVPAKMEEEMVCVSFSLLLWAFLEQQRLIDGVIYPFACGRVKIKYPAVTKEGWGGHSMVGFVNPSRKFFLIEPQDDQVHDGMPYSLPQGSWISEAHFL